MHGKSWPVRYRACPIKSLHLIPGSQWEPERQCPWWRAIRACGLFKPLVFAQTARTHLTCKGHRHSASLPHQVTEHYINLFNFAHAARWTLEIPPLFLNQEIASSWAIRGLYMLCNNFVTGRTILPKLLDVQTELWYTVHEYLDSCSPLVFKCIHQSQPYFEVGVHPRSPL